MGTHNERACGALAICQRQTSVLPPLSLYTHELSPQVSQENERNTRAHGSLGTQRYTRHKTHFRETLSTHTTHTTVSSFNFKPSSNAPLLSACAALDSGAKRECKLALRNGSTKRALSARRRRRARESKLGSSGSMRVQKKRRKVLPATDATDTGDAAV